MLANGISCNFFEGTCDTEVNRMVALETVNWVRHNLVFKDDKGIIRPISSALLGLLCFLNLPYS